MKNRLKKIFHFFFRIIFAKLLMPKPRKNIRKVLLSGYTGLGHIVLKTTLIKKIEELFPDCKIYVINDNVVQSKPPYSGHVGTEMILYKYEMLYLSRESNFLKFLFFFWKLRKEKIDVVFLTFDSSPKILIRGSIIAGIPIRIGHIFAHLPIPTYYYSHKVLINKQKVRDEIYLNFDLLDSLCNKRIQRNYIPSIVPIEQPNLLKNYNLLKNNYMCIQMGCKSGHNTATRWGENNFRELIKKLLLFDNNIRIVALGDQGDSPIVDRICEGFNSDRLLNLAGKTNLGETISLIATCRLLICHDSGLLHVGNALQKTVIALYGPSEPDIYALKMSSFHYIQKECDCPFPRPGLFPGVFEPTDEDYASKCTTHNCMKKITVENVYEKCLQLLQSEMKLETNIFPSV